jgi:hypothetical protein
MQTPILRDFCFDSDRIRLKITKKRRISSRRWRELGSVSVRREDDGVLAGPT